MSDYRFTNGAEAARSHVADRHASNVYLVRVGLRITPASTKAHFRQHEVI